MKLYKRSSFILFVLIATAFAIEAFKPINEEQKKKAETNKIAQDAISKMRTTSTPEQRVAYGQALRKIGWNCPDVKNIRWDDDDADGQHAKIMCGPNNGRGDVYKDRIFRTTLRTNGRFEAKQVGLMD